ncbi:MAG: hypothetical protein H0T11_08410 [Chthoniobacterales bacterium]|nr:hypothetical protein [Chthoniobacterales bacterium]
MASRTLVERALSVACLLARFDLAVDQEQVIAAAFAEPDFANGDASTGGEIELLIVPNEASGTL